MESLFIFFVMSIFILMTLVSFGIIYSIIMDCKNDPSEIRWAISLLAIVLIMGIYGLVILGYFGG